MRAVRAEGMWVRLLVDALVVYALWTVGVSWWLLTVLGMLVAVAGYKEWQARVGEDG